jgi:hypothetical protein
MFTTLIDFMHIHKVEQLVGVGPSAYPYVLALERAYQKRYGTGARSLHVVNLGEAGERLYHFKPAARENARNFLLRVRPRFKLKTPTLLFDEEISTSQSMKGLSTIFRALGVPHKTAVLFKLHGDLDKDGDTKFMPDHWGRYVDMNDPLRLKVYIERGDRMDNLRRFPSTTLKANWRAFMQQIRQELREVADSVPRKEQAKTERK